MLKVFSIAAAAAILFGCAGPDQQKPYGQASKPRATQTARVTQDAALSVSQRTAKTTELPIFLGAAY